MEDDRDSLWRKINHYVRLRREFSDERFVRALDLMITQARERLLELERGGG